MEEIAEELNKNPSAIGGVYYEDDELHVIPLGTDKMELMSDSNYYKEQDIVFDKPVKYSMQDLIDAQEELSNNWDDLGITGIMTDIFNNRICVYAENWTEEKKETIISLLDIDNIHFGIDEGVIPEDFSD